jgi:hypothetical protein
VVVLATTVDPAGRRVVLDETEWEHIVEAHGEMVRFFDEIIGTVARPDFVTPDPILPRMRYWRHSIGPSRWLRVVVDFETEPLRIVTAFPNRRDPPGWPSGLLP